MVFGIASRSRMFAPPFGPSHLVSCARGLHDDPLIGGTEGLGKTRQCGLDEPRFKGDPCGLSVGIEFPGHSQRLQCTGAVLQLIGGQPKN